MSQNVEKQQSETNEFEKVDDGLYGLELSEEEKKKSLEKVKEHSEDPPSWYELTSRFKNNVLTKQYPLFHLITILLVNSTILLGSSLFTIPASIFYLYLAVNNSSTKTTNIISNIGTTILLALTCIWYPTIGSNIILGIAVFLIYWRIKNDTGPIP